VFVQFEVVSSVACTPEATVAERHANTPELFSPVALRREAIAQMRTRKAGKRAFTHEVLIL